MNHEDSNEELSTCNLTKFLELTRELKKLEGENRSHCEELIRIKSMLQGLFEFATEAIIVVDGHGTIVQANPQTEKFFGYPREEILNQPVEILIPERFHKRHVEHRRHYMSEPRHRALGKGLELYGRRKDGSEFPVDISLSPIETGQETNVLCVVRDFTYYRRLEKTFLESQERYRKLIEVSPDAIFIQSEERFVFTNQAGVNLLGASDAEQILGKSIWEFVHPDYWEVIKERIRKIREEGLEAPLLEEKFIRLDGSVGDVEVAAMPFSYQDKAAVLAVVHDITQRKRYEADLIRSNKELEQYAYVVSHDLQEPLISLLGYCQLIYRRSKGKFDAETEKFFTSALELGNKMQMLIQGLLNYCRVGASGQPFAPTDFNEVLQQTLKSLSHIIDSSGAMVTYEPLPTLRADQSEIGRVFQNLIDNGLKFGREKSQRIHISANREKDGWVFSVRDNGIGIKSEDCQRLFAMFQRINPAAGIPGTGIGLAICKKIIERHGGRIWVESEAGKGSAFYFKLPERLDG